MDTFMAMKVKVKSHPPELAKEVKGPLAVVKEEVEEEEGEPISSSSAAAALDKEKQGNAGKNVPPFLKSMYELRGLSAALSIFIRRFEELQKHLDFIGNSIETRSTQLEAENKAQKEVVVPLPLASAAELQPNEADNSGSQLEYICDNMGSRGLRKYFASHLSDIAKLRQEAPAAIKRAPNPAKLVLDCIGRFYMQGKKAYTRDSFMVTTRHASLLILECFLFSGCCTHIDSSVKEEAELAAIAWRKRLISEGGLSIADGADAQGLLLFVASYGIPSEFGNQDLLDLILLCNPGEIAHALHQSPFLLKRFPDIMEGMVKNGMYIVAVDITFSFGLEDKISPQAILAAFLRDSNEAWKRAKKESQGSPGALKQANEKRLADLISVLKCLEDHKIDPTELSGWGINVKIAKLEKDISDLDRKIEEKVISKRKADDEVESLKKLKTQEVKRPRPVTEVSPQIHDQKTQEIKNPWPITRVSAQIHDQKTQEEKRSQPITAVPPQIHDQKTQEVKCPRPFTEVPPHIRDQKTNEVKCPRPITEVPPQMHDQEVKCPRPFTEVLPPQIHSMVMRSPQTIGLSDGKSLHDGGFSVMLNGYLAASSVTGAGLHGASGSGLLYDGGIAAGTIDGVSAGNGDVLPTGSLAGIGGGFHVGDGVRHLTNNGVGSSYLWHGGGTLNNNSVGHNFVGPPASMVKGLYGSSPMEQGILVQPTKSLDFGNRGSDLYQFADTVLEGESHYGSSSRSGNPAVAPTASLARRPYYLF